MQSNEANYINHLNENQIVVHSTSQHSTTSVVRAKVCEETGGAWSLGQCKTLNASATRATDSQESVEGYDRNIGC